MSRYFNGTTQYFTIADAPALTLALPWSIGGWVDATNNAGTGDGVIVAWSYIAYTPSFSLRARHHSASWRPDELRVSIQDGDADAVNLATVGSALGTAGVWQHVLVTCTAGGLVTAYVDGDSKGSDTNALLGTADAAAAFYFGAIDILPAEKYFNGDLAEWAKWDTALSPEQIAALAAGVRPTEIGSRPAWYLPMSSGFEEEIAGLAITNYGTTVAEHPPCILTAGNIL